jgi:hypothetical protein
VHAILISVAWDTDINVPDGGDQGGDKAIDKYGKMVDLEKTI